MTTKKDSLQDAHAQSHGQGAGLWHRRRDVAQAVALEYAPVDRQSAPRIIGRGIDQVAERLLAEAERLNIPIRHDGDLLQLLQLCEIGDEIPIEAFVAVAEILRVIYARSGRMPPTPSGNSVAKHADR